MNKLFLILSFCFILNSAAQIKTYKKALETFAQGNLKGANKLADKCLEHPETKNNPNVLLLKSKIMFAISKDGALFEKFPSAAKDAMKFAEKAISAEKNESTAKAFKNANLEYLSILVRSNNKEAVEAYNLKKYAKALPLFKRSMTFELDTQSLVLAADCYWLMDQRSESVPLFKKAADMIYTAVLDSNSKVFGYHKEPFRKLCLYYIDHEAYDSAYVVVKNGREILPNDPVLNEYTYRLMRHALDRIPPSEDYLRTVQTALKDFPSDSFLNHRENSIYIYLLNGMAMANEQIQFDSLLKQYAASKEAKIKLKQVADVRRFDIFAGETANVFVPHLKLYFAEIGLRDACYATFIYEQKRFFDYEFNTLTAIDQHKSLPANPGSKPTVTKVESVLENRMAARLRNENNTRVAEFIFERHLQLNTKSSVFRTARAEYLNSRNSSSLKYGDLVSLIHMNDAAASDFPKNSGFKQSAKVQRMRLVSEAADSGNFRLSRSTWQEARQMYPDQVKPLDLLWRKMVENDFLTNYYGTRINPKGKNEAGVPVYAWNGVADSCLAGTMPDEVMLRAERRINYFRRMAGLNEEIVLSSQDNEYCMYAALMCEANKSMSHEPSDGWRCFIPAGLDALKNAILSKDGNPAIAVTAAMGQNHPSVGNRRWLLYPKAQYMGIGTSKTYTAIKAVDQTRELDSIKYRQQYVAWPPAGDCPKMLIFKKWSFSIDLKLEGAVVRMTDAQGNAVGLKQEIVVNGYGMNTLVWEPELNAGSLPDNSLYQVEIRLKDGQIFRYQVRMIEIALK